MADNMKLNMGVTIVPGSADAYEEVVDMERYIPEDHRHLVRFLSADLNEIDEMLKKAVSENNRTLSVAAAALLEETHRFFELPGRKEAYINRSLAGIVWTDDGITPAEKDSVFAGLALLDNCNVTDLPSWLSPENGKGTIPNLIEVRDDLKIMLPVVFDDSNGLSAYPQQVRNGLYGLVSTESSLRPFINLTPGRTILPSPESMGGLRAAMDFNEEFGSVIYDSVKSIAGGSDDVPAKLGEILDRVAGTDGVEYWTEYDTPYLEDILRLEVSLMAGSGTRLRKCKSCGRYFPVTPENDRCCNIPDADGSSCLTRYREKLLKETVSAIYTQAYRTHFARMKAGKETKEELDSWREFAKRLRRDVYAGNLSPDEYKEKLMHS